jgi:ABC-2 type transport system ATP-binding protein
LIQTSEIRVDYGEVTAVSDLSLSIDTGEVFGLIGPNGAGKTSLIRVLATLGEPTYGNAIVAGFNIFEDRTKARRQIGYMPDLAPVFKDIRCWEFLDLFAAAYGILRNDRRRRIDEVLEVVDLTTKRTAMAGTLSRGMTQRLVLAKTLLHDPAVLLLDEPASGLDPIARIDLRNLLRDLSARGKTVLISSHILSDLNDFCSSIGIMEKGRLALSGSIDDLVGRLNTTRRYIVQTIGPAAAAAEVLGARQGVIAVEHDQSRCEFACSLDDEGVAALLGALVRASSPIVAFHEQKRGVEDLLIQAGVTEVS